MPVVPSFLERLIFLRLNLGPGPALDLAGGAMFRAVGIALRLGVFEALARRAQSSATLSEELGADARDLTAVLELLVAGRYLRRRGERYELTALSRKWLVKASPASLRHFLLLWDAVLFEYWQRLEHAVSRRRPMLHLHEWLAAKPERWPLFNAAMAELARGLADEIAAKLTLPESAAWVLDVGGSHALYSIALLRRHPSLRAVVLDRPEALADAAPNVAAAGMEERVELRMGDFTRDELGERFDLALLFNVLHYGDAPAAGALLSRVAAALRSGGILAILDQLAPAAPSSSAAAAFNRMLALNYVVGLGGETFSLADLDRWCAAAGLSRLKRIGLRRAPGSALLLATKG